MQSTFTDSSDSRAKVNSRFVPVKVLRGVADCTDDRLARALDAKLVGKSELMQTLKRSMRLVARCEETVIAGGLLSVLQPFAALYALILASASPLLAKESERINGLFVWLLGRLRRKKKADAEVEDAKI